MSSSSILPVKPPSEESFDVKDAKVRAAVAMSVHRETLYTAKSLYTTVHSFQALFDRYLGKPGSKAASAAMAVDAGISRPMGLVDALTRIENLKLELKDQTDALDTAKAESLLQTERHELQHKAMVAVFQQERLELEKNQVRLKIAQDTAITGLKRQLRLTKALAIEKVVKKKSPFFGHSVFTAWRQQVTSRNLLEEAKGKVLSELGDVGLKLMKTEAKNTHLKLKYQETRSKLLAGIEAEGGSGVSRLVFTVWRSMTGDAKLQQELEGEREGRYAEVAKLNGELGELRNAFTSSRQDFRRTTQSLDKLRDDHMQVKEELELAKAKSGAVDDMKKSYDAEVELLKVENIQLRGKLGEALESLAAAEAADSDLGVLFSKYRELEKEYRILKKVLYPTGREEFITPTGVNQCANCRAHVLHRSTISDDSRYSLNSTTASHSFTLPPVATRPGPVPQAHKTLGSLAASLNSPSNAHSTWR